MSALNWAELQKLAREGDPYALVVLGSKYLHPEAGSPQPDTAVSCYLEAANRGLALAQVLAAQHYRNGNGVAVDHQKARMWLQKAAVQGAPVAYHELALIYLGEGNRQHAL